MNYINAGKLKSFLENVPPDSYVAVGTRENNEIEEIRQESGIVDMNIKSVGFDPNDSTLVAPLRAESIQAITANAAQVNYYYESHFCIRTKERMFQRQIEINKTTQSNDVIEEIIEEDTPIIIEETHYVDMDVPTGKTFKSYMDARLITNKSSAQYELKSEYELDESGIYMIDGRYTCAVGSYYTTKIGTKFDVVMVSGEVIPCI